MHGRIITVLRTNVRQLLDQHVSMLTRQLGKVPSSSPSLPADGRRSRPHRPLYPVPGQAQQHRLALFAALLIPNP